MSEFTKEKIAFAIGLLAVLFTLTPLLESYGQFGFAIFGWRLEVRHLYLVLAATLSLGVYFYGIQFLTTRSIRLPTAIGDVFYALAMVAPALYLCLFVIALFIEVATPYLRTPLVLDLIEGSLSAVAGATAVLLWQRTRKALAIKQKQSEVRQRFALELGALQRAEELLHEGHYDLAVVEAFRALELAARDASSDRGSRRGSRDWFQQLVQRVPEDLRPSLERAREARNKAAHAAEPISEEVARQALSTISKALAVVGSAAVDACPECGSKRMIEETGSDHGFAWTRRRCGNCGFLDLS